MSFFIQSTHQEKVQWLCLIIVIYIVTNRSVSEHTEHRTVFKLQIISVNNLMHPSALKIGLFLEQMAPSVIICYHEMHSAGSNDFNLEYKI